jgi:NifU-like protein involved in Fe-S cluster formation
MANQIVSHYISVRNEIIIHDIEFHTYPCGHYVRTGSTTIDNVLGVKVTIITIAWTDSLTVQFRGK